MPVFFINAILRWEGGKDALKGIEGPWIQDPTETKLPPGKDGDDYLILAGIRISCWAACKKGMPYAHRMNAKTGELFHKWLAFGLFDLEDKT